MIVTGLWGRNTRNHVGFSSPENRPSLRPVQPSAKRVAGVKLGFEDDHSLPFRAKFKHEWSHTSTRPTPLWNAWKQLYLSAQPCLFQKSSFYECDLFLEVGQVVM